VCRYQELQSQLCAAQEKIRAEQAQMEAATKAADTLKEQEKSLALAMRVSEAKIKQQLEKKVKAEMKRLQDMQTQRMIKDKEVSHLKLQVQKLQQKQSVVKTALANA
jgi:hypothetical protein